MKKTFFKTKVIYLLQIVILITIVTQSCKKDKTEPDFDILAKSTSLEDVQAAVDMAEIGDVVKIPIGNSIWTSTLDIPDDKKITLIGTCVESTIISGTETAPGTMLDMNKSGSRVSQITFKFSNDNGVCINVDGTGWRIDNCRFINEISQTIEGVMARGTGGDPCPIGVVDHCLFLNSRVLIIGDAGLMANEIWLEPLGLGTNNAVFVEDCTFNYTKFGNAVDTNYGGRYVFRYNTVNDAYIEAHSLQGTHRATRSWEIYENKINQVNSSMWAPFFMRGGTGVIFNNTITGNWSSGPTIIVDNRRTFQDLGEGGFCDGTSLWDGNEEANGYPGRDQIGRSTDSWLWTDSNPYPPQELDPFYQWNNTHNGNPIQVYVHNNCGIHIKENRDYYNETERPGYTPFTYPHPLVID